MPKSIPEDITETKERSFWIDNDPTGSGEVRSILFVEIGEASVKDPKNKLSNKEVSDLSLEAEEIIAEWLPSPEHLATIAIDYSEEIEDQYSFLKTFSRNNNVNKLYDVYEEAIGRWDGDLKDIMNMLSMEKVTMPSDEKDYLIQKKISELPEMHGWKVELWKVESLPKYLEGKVRNLICDRVIWQAEFDGIPVSIETIMGWDPYKQ